MSRFEDIVKDENDMFGPGTDLIVSLMAVLLILLVIGAHFFTKNQDELSELMRQNEVLKNEIEVFNKERTRFEQKAEDGGNFKLASVSFSAGHFMSNPVTMIADPDRTEKLVDLIVREFKEYAKDYPYLFIIGHSNQLDDPLAKDKSLNARLERNWGYAGRRAVVIARLVQERLSESEKERIVVVTTGEFDMRSPGLPLSSENAWVEVVFGKEWKLPAASLSQE